MKLAELPKGVRFVLLRSGKRYEVVDPFCGYHVKVRDAIGRDSKLHRSCFVKPIVKAGGAL